MTENSIKGSIGSTAGGLHTVGVQRDLGAALSARQRVAEGASKKPGRRVGKYLRADGRWEGRSAAAIS